jgi:hypothetical protein
VKITDSEGNDDAPRSFDGLNATTRTVMVSFAAAVTVSQLRPSTVL